MSSKVAFLVFFFLTVLYDEKQVSCLSNDIVASLRCQLLCRDIYGYSQEITQDNVCLCRTDEKIIGKNFIKIQEKSKAFNLPIRILDGSVRRKRDDAFDGLKEKFEEFKDKLTDLFENRDTPKTFDEIVARAKESWQDGIEGLQSYRDSLLEKKPFAKLRAKEPELFDAQNLKATFEDAQQKLKDKLDELKDPDTYKSLFKDSQDKMAELRDKHNEQKEAILGQLMSPKFLNRRLNSGADYEREIVKFLDKEKRFGRPKLIVRTWVAKQDDAEESGEKIEGRGTVSSRLSEVDAQNKDAHVEDSVKKSLDTEKSHEDEGERNQKAKNKGIIVQPSQLISEFEDDLDALT